MVPRNREQRGASTLTVKRLGAICVSACLIGSLLAGCSAEPPAQEAAEEKKTIAVKVEKVEKLKIAEPDEAVADVQPSLHMDVVLKASGDIKEVLKKRGDTVKQGEVLLRIDAADAELQVAKARLGQSKAVADLEKARLDIANGRTELVNSVAKLDAAVKESAKLYNRAKNEYDLGKVTTDQLVQLETQYNNQQMDLDSLRNKLATYETSNSIKPLEVQLQSADIGIQEATRALANYEIKAPMSGVLTYFPFRSGMTVSQGMQAAQVQQTDPVKLVAELSDLNAAKVRGKQQLQFYIAGTKERRTATVTFLSTVVNIHTKTYTLELEAANADQAVKPGMKAQVLLNTDQDQTVPAIPTSSIVRESGSAYVFVLEGETVSKRKVELGRLKELKQEIVSGVKEGDYIVVSGQHQLKDKEKVTLAK